MHFDPEHWKAALFGFGMVRDVETGEIRWPVIVGGIIVAGGVAVGGFIVQMGNTISAVAATQKLMAERLDKIELSVHPSTSKRYTSDDAARDLDLVRSRIKDGRDDARRDHEEVIARLQRLEDRGRR
jgi:hypothetical protein